MIFGGYFERVERGFNAGDNDDNDEADLVLVVL